jgi:hypothetical protein
MLITGGLFTSGVLLQKGSPPPPVVSTPLFNATSENNWADLTRSGNPAQIGNYLVFTGSQSLSSTYIDTTTLANDDYTYEFWLRTTGANSGKILGKIGTGGYHVSAVEISSTGLVVGYWSEPQVYSEVSTAVTRDAWQHYTVTYSTTTGALKTYYNGQMEDFSTLPAEVSPRDYSAPEMWFDLFGSESTNFGNGGALTADFGEFRLYTRALSDAEVLQNFQATRGRWGI